MGADPKNVPTNLNNLESKVDKLNVDKLVPVPVDLSKLSDAVKNVIKEDVPNAKIKHIEDKIPDITKKKLYDPFLWIEFHCLKARATSRRQFTFYH